MGILIEGFIWLIIESFFGFIFYSTGCFILKVIKFGQYKATYKDFTVFRASKEKKIGLIGLLGLSFYIGLITLIVFANS